jgi:hypothetical protein
MALGRISFGARIICFALPRHSLEPPMGLGIGRLSELIARDTDQIVAIIREETRALQGRAKCPFQMG